MRRASRLLRANPKTIARKLEFLGKKAQQLNRACSELNPLGPDAEVQFDELETFEHTKMKPLSVPLAVETKTRRILAFQVARMPAKGLLAEKSCRKYGKRKDERPRALHSLLKEVRACSPVESALKLIRSDSNPHYPKLVKRMLPETRHIQEIGREGCIVGQGELKKVGFDPLFSLNHTCAMLRANVNRLMRRTWCTTKKPDRLAHHLALYVSYHNHVLLQLESASTA